MLLALILIRLVLPLLYVYTKKYFFYNSSFKGLSNNIIFANTLFKTLLLRLLLLRWLLLKMNALDPSHFAVFEHVKFFSSHFAVFEHVKNFSSHFAVFEHVKNFGSHFANFEQ